MIKGKMEVLIKIFCKINFQSLCFVVIKIIKIKKAMNSEKIQYSEVLEKNLL
jgi:hypothetical protein